MYISKNDHQKLSNIVQTAESKTSGEIVPMIVNCSDFYPAAHFRSALLFFALTSALMLFSSCSFFEDSFHIFYGQVLSLGFGYSLAFIPFVKKHMSTKFEKEIEVHQRAKQAFLDHGVYKTKNSTGILIFLSLMEQRVEIIADQGINEKVGPHQWEDMVQALIKEIKAGQFVNGLEKCIHSCGEILSQSFPIAEDDTNELSNKIIQE